MRCPSRARKASRGETGMTLIETMLAVLVLMVGVLIAMSLLSLAVIQNANQGERVTRSAECAQDKMEQLLALDYADATTKTTVYPPASTGGTGLGGAMAGNTTVGGVNPATPVTGYVDYLDANENLLSSATGAVYVRQWSITTNAAGNLKTITVLARAISSVGAQGAGPSTTLVSTKSN